MATYQIRPRVTTSLDSRLWIQTLSADLNVDVMGTVINERPDVPIVNCEIDDAVAVATVVATGHKHNLTVLEM